MHFPEAAVTSEHRPHLVHHGDLMKETKTADENYTKNLHIYTSVYEIMGMTQI